MTDTPARRPAAEVLDESGITVTAAGKARWRAELAKGIPADVRSAGARMRADARGEQDQAA
jgi:hypothetical protein